MRSEVRVLLDPPALSPAWGLSSAGRASALQAEGHRFDPDRLHQWLRLDRQAPWGVLPSNRTQFDNREERETSEPLVRPSVGVTWGRRDGAPAAVLFQVKYTNQMSRCPIGWRGGKLYDFRPGVLRRMARARLGFGAAQRGAGVPCRLWIGSSARRAFGGCLGSKRR